MFSIISLLIALPGILIGLTVHEFAHAYTAYLCGDKLAKTQGRLSLNPLKHIDPLGFLFILFAGFGWAKPVQVDDRNLKNPEIDAIKVALAGPFSNILLAILFSFLFALYSFYTEEAILGYILLYAVYINWGLFFFNIIPIPPLDGSHIFFGNLKNKNPELYINIYKFGMMGLFFVLLLESFTKIDILPIGKVSEYWGDYFIDLFSRLIG